MFYLNMVGYLMSSLLLSTWFFLPEQVEGVILNPFTLWVFLLEASFMLKSWGWWGGLGGGP